jgi:hypothetical protein
MHLHLLPRSEISTTVSQSTAWVPIPIGFTVHTQNHWILSGFRIGLNLNGYGYGCPFNVMDNPFNVDMCTNLWLHSKRLHKYIVQLTLLKLVMNRQFNAFKSRIYGYIVRLSPRRLSKFEYYAFVGLPNGYPYPWKIHRVWTWIIHSMISKPMVRFRIIHKTCCSTLPWAVGL